MQGGLLVREARLRAGLTQAELAHRLSTSQPVVARWETGATSPAYDTVVRAIRACGLDLSVAIMPYDDSDRLHIAHNLRRTPPERAEMVEAMYELEQMLHAARPVVPTGVGTG